MASFYSTADSRGYRLRLDVTQESQSVENNTSTIKWFLYLVTGNNWYFTRYTLSNTLTWVDVDTDGTKEWNWPTGEQFSCLGANKTTLVASGTKTIPHNADGTKTISASASFRTNTASTAYGPVATLTVSGSFALTTIPRASLPTLSSYSLNLGETVTITTNRASTSFTHDLTYQIGSKTGSIASGIGDSDLWTLPYSLADAIPTSTSGTVTITCKTYSGTTLVGSKTVSLTATVPNTATFKPTASISSITEAVTMPSGISVFVQGKSQLKVISTGVSKYPANNISQVKVSVAGANYYGTTITSATVMMSGTVTVSLTVTDKRGFYSTVSQNVTVYAYAPPSISSFSARRSPDDQGTGLYSAYTYAVSAVNNQNTVSWALRYRIAGATTWTNIVTATTPYSTAGTRTTPNILNGNISYEIGFSLTDKWSTTAQTLNVGSVFDLMNFNASGRGIAFGKVSEKDAFEVGMPAEFSSSLKKNGLDVMVDVDLSSQIQMTSYRYSVIALCELTNTNPSFNSYSNGVLTFHRINSLMGEVKVDIAMAKRYNTTQPNVTMLSLAVNQGVVPCTFTYNGVKYGGVHVNINSAEFNEVHFYGVSNFNIFGLDYYQTNTSSILNAEVNSSVNFNDHLYTGYLYFQNQNVMTGSGGDVYWNDILSKPDTSTRWPTWSEVTSKPTTFAPTSHTHTAAQLPNAYSLLWSGTLSAVNGTATLNSAYTNFDMLLIYAPMYSDPGNAATQLIPTGQIILNQTHQFTVGATLTTSYMMYINYMFTSSTVLKVTATGGPSTESIRAIYGIKLV